MAPSLRYTGTPRQPTQPPPTPRFEQILLLLEQQAINPTAVLAASLVPAAAHDTEGTEARTGVDAVVAAAAARLVAT